MSSSNIHPPGYDFDTAETAGYIGISTATISQWAVKKINIPYVLIGNKRWYRQDDVDLYILSRMVKVAPLPQDAAAWIMYASLSKLAALAQQAPNVDCAVIDGLVRTILSDDDQLITAREVSEMVNGPSIPTLARWRLKGTGPDFFKDSTNGHILYRKGDFQPKKVA